MTFYSAADSVLDNVYAISKVYYVITHQQMVDKQSRTEKGADVDSDGSGSTVQYISLI